MPGEQVIRLAFFFSVLAVVAIWEVIAPRRALTGNKRRRWVANLSLVAINTVAVRLIFPIFPTGISLLAQERGWGMLNVVNLPIWAKSILAVVALDFIIYLQHVLFHFLPILWRIHRMHHTDLDIDVTTGNRFHPMEILISMGIKLAAVSLIGAPTVAVVIFEVVLNATSQFNHGNIFIHDALDRWLRLAVITPDMHRVHNSIIPRETNSNFGFNLPWWDRLCGTYRAQPEEGHEGMTIGLKEFREPAMLTLTHLLIQPFARKST
ncbi:sterol desaturase family protein [Oryzomonas japonica]|uniref:Sterol desaturase family protein n=1 Tax=Oryzomonas japonica TaxID=2603858 RepID=A0A7J4ZVT5_9BACT|nr:sterol desaturase family protein [Oryzomonas japonica]KAB0667726.1 sterol desaturase family protein [Oryzomonas japonica]